MQFSLLQVFLLLLITFSFTRVYLRAREGRVEQGAVIFWILIWGGAIFIVLFPNFTTILANKIGVGRGADAVLYFALITLFYMVFRTNVALENLKQDLTELVRQLALQDDQKSQDESKVSRSRK